jgi:hypothetical protein
LINSSLKSHTWKNSTFLNQKRYHRTLLRVMSFFFGNLSERNLGSSGELEPDHNNGDRSSTDAKFNYMLVFTIQAGCS